MSAVNTNVQGDVQSVLKENMFSQSLHIKEVKITEYKAEKKSLNLFFFLVNNKKSDTSEQHTEVEKNTACIICDLFFFKKRD